MPASKKRPKVVEPEIEVKAINPLKTRWGRVLIVILAVGFFLSMLVAMVYGMIQVFQ